MLVSLTEAAAANGLTPSTLRTHCQQGRVVGAVRIGNRWALPVGALTFDPPLGRARRPRKETA